MAGTNNDSGQDKPMVDPQKQYLIEQFGNLMEKVGEGYGGPLQEELIRRMEQTIADFDEEVSEMLEHLRDSSVKRHEKLKEISCLCIVQHHDNVKERILEIYKQGEIPLIYDCQHKILKQSNPKTILEFLGE